MPDEPLAQILLVFVLPLWMAAGFADWLCHRASAIERTAGPGESLLHLLMLAEIGVPLLAGLLLEINALVLVVAIVAWILHEATAFWDLRFAAGRRQVSPVEQHVHSYLGVLPLLTLLAVIALHWDRFAALFGSGSEPADFAWRWKVEPLPPLLVLGLLAAVLLFAVLPYAEELWRGLRARRAVQLRLPLNAVHARVRRGTPAPGPGWTQYLRARGATARGDLPMAQDRNQDQGNRQHQQGNPGNFANDRERASEAGRKGGHESGGNFANDRERASEAGRKGGQSSGQQR